MATSPINAQTILETAFANIGVTEPLDAAMAQDGLRRLNQMVNLFLTQYQTSPFINRETFATVANQATYTIGPGGDFNTSRPLDLTGSGLLQNPGTSAEVEIPRQILTDDQYEAITMKGLTGNMWTAVYFNPNFDQDRASIFLWPTPTSNAYGIAVYRRDNLTEFASLTQTYYLPPGYAEMYAYNLATRLAAPYGRTGQVPAEIAEFAAQSRMNIKRQNTKLNDLQLDPAFTTNPSGLYNILTGQGGAN